jgi:hypothetical protein
MPLAAVRDTPVDLDGIAIPMVSLKLYQTQVSEGVIKALGTCLLTWGGG